MRITVPHRFSTRLCNTMKNRPLTPDKKQATIVIKKKTSRKGSNARVARIDTFPLKTISLCVFMSCNSAWATDYLILSCLRLVQEPAMSIFLLC
ncbi:Uncharacterised protein [Klebsiella pneumoniae]|uniref:Uncharacterized protein n=1 Tax=Klebsiella pneumoniae TaxID=573 RepID=A0A377U2M2_KLEPN|nr:Uncharacterised protein [Klebsiella pneumoniae]